MIFRLKVAPRRGPRANRVLLSKKTGIARSLEEIGIEHQLQLSRPFRWELATIRFETLGLLALSKKTCRNGASLGPAYVCNQDNLHSRPLSRRMSADSKTKNILFALG